ncbi:amino acid adenylation domain-containing protein/non-ribosomal peptide synthase protein (TIGR01720 family) [Chitinophaga sp. W3I9]|uniref:amino acid adenylation domain-containing protein n=1 Tax=Chitinophaga sp. W3I9 TaxID=3373924 RepID=UPI003D216D95
MNKKLIHSVFEGVVHTNPSNIAIETADGQMSYSDLNIFANRISALLKHIGCGKGTIVNVLVPPSIQMIAAMIGVFKSGGIYLPVDINFAEARLLQIFKDTFNGIIIIDAGLQDTFLSIAQRLEIPSAHYIIVDGQNNISIYRYEQGSITPQAFEEQPTWKDNPPLTVEGDDSNYIFYTSGTTGNAKGIEGAHAGLSHFIHWEIGEFGITADVRVSQLTQFTFDASLRDIFVALIAGGTLFIPPADVKTNPASLLQWLSDNKITLIHCVPSLFRVFIKEMQWSDARRYDLSNLQYLLMAGEMLYAKDILEWRKLAGDHVQLVNLYGPTETTMIKSFYRIGQVPENPSQGIPVGSPISNTNIAIIKDGYICNAGEIGEIYIKTPFATKGYYKNEALTAECFVQNPLTQKDKDIVYKTGDLGRYLSDGHIEILGRLDSQVKVNGIRVELIEIEKALLELDNVHQAVVKPYRTDDNSISLIAYYTGIEKSVDDFRYLLARRLNAQIIPFYFIRLEAFPLNVNGKIDKKALPVPEDILMGGIDFEAPEGEIEEKLSEFWKEILGYKKIGRNISFFGVGGHSLRAIQLVSRIQNQFNITIRIADIFTEHTIRKQASFIVATMNTSYVSIQPAAVQPHYALSSAQRRLWVLCQFEDGNMAYNMPGAYILKGALNRDALENAFNQLITRHESLRTVFREQDGGEIRQFILSPEDINFKIAYSDFRNKADKEALIKKIIRAESLHRFDLSRGPLLRAVLFQLDDDRHALIYTMHHIISDDWSMRILVEELFALYNAHVLNREVHLTALRIQYKDYAAWQQEQLRGEALETHRNYWLEQFSGALPVLQLPADKPRPAVKSYNGDIIYGVIEPELAYKFKTFLQQQGDTLFMGLLAVVNALLYRYTAQGDIIIGCPVAARSNIDLENQIGFYTNILPLRTRFSSDSTFAELLREVRQVTVDAYRHEAFPFDQLVDELRLRRDMSRAPLFDVFVDLHDTVAKSKINAEIGQNDLEITPYEEEEHHVSKFDLTFMFTNTEKEIYLSVEYNTDIYNKETILLLYTHFLQLMEAATAAPFVAVSKLKYLSASEEKTLLSAFNEEYEVQFPYQPVHVLFEKNAMLSPDAIAVVFQQESFTYQQLNDASNRVADYLANESAVKPGESVGIMLDRSEKMIIAILGILKAGAVYVPIDPAYPEKRKEYIMRDAALKALITQTDYIFDISYFEGSLFAIDAQLETIAESGQYAIQTTSQSNHLAYVLYTSGSTGMPKGCEITHGSLSHYVQWACHHYLGNGLKGNFALFTSLSFDLTVTSIFSPLINGSTLHIYGQEQPVTDILRDSFGKDSGIDCMKLTPSHVRLLKGLSLESSRVLCVIVGGEAVMPDDVSTLKALNPEMKVYNEYGPTEATVGCVVKELELNTEILIGRPIAGAEICILDSQRSLVPVGVYGEICIGGAGLARGYLNRKELTEEKFIPHPYREGERLYLTGDTGRWQPNGEIAYAGRTDEQVKVRGYRIETAEIEHALLKGEFTSAAVVKVWPGEDGENELVAYLAGESHDIPQLRAYLLTQLPGYMIPHQFISIPEIPLTTNGKADRKALPAPGVTNTVAGSEYIAARNEVEAQLIAVYEEVLRKQGVGVQDDFFMLGGDSIKSIQVVSRLKQRGFILTIQDVMQHPVIADLSLCVRTLGREASQELVTGHIPLSPVQQWFFQTAVAAPHHYNQSVLLESREPLAVPALKAALDKILLHHDALRMVYHPTATGWLQENKGSEQSYLLEIIDWTDDVSFAACCDRIQRSADLDKGPLFRVGLFRGTGKDRLLLVAHHLVIDAVSWRILLDDLSSLYQEYAAGISTDLPAKTDSFQYWQQQLQEHAKSSVLKSEQPYWDAIEGVAVAGLPLDNVGGSNQIKDIDTCAFVLDKDMTSRLQVSCYKACGAEMNDILLTALSLAVQEVFETDDVMVRLEGHGREDIGNEVNVTRTIGWFTTMYPVVFNMRYHKDPVRQLIAVKEKLHRIPSKGIGYGVLRYMTEQGYKLQPQIGFNYLGDFGAVLNKEQTVSAFTFSGVYRGVEIPADMERDLLLDVSGMIADERMKLSIDYSREQFNHATIDRLATAFRQHLEVLTDKLSAATVTTLTPVDLTYKELEVEQVMELQRETMLEDVYTLSPFQEGLYYHWLATPGSPMYFEQMSYRLKGKLDIAILKQSYYTLVSRHAVMRTYFTQRFGERLLQVVSRSVSEGFSVLEPAGDGESFVEAFREQDRLRGFDLHKGSQMRLTVIDMGEEMYEFVWSHHHIIMDGWCVSILVKEFFQIYEGLKTGVAPELGRVYPYAGYIKWLNSINSNNTLNYWRNYLSGYDTVSTLPRMKAPEIKYRGTQQSLLISGDIRTDIRKLCTVAGITESTFIQTVWGILLGKYNDTDDVVFGTVVSGRPAHLEGMEEMIGLFSNAIPVRIRPKRTSSIRNLLKEVQQMWIEGADHHYMQLAEIQAASSLGRNLMDHMLVFENYPVVEAVEENMESVRGLSVLSSGIFGRANYDMMITVIARDSIVIKFDYNKYVYEDSQIERMKSHLMGIVNAVLNDIDTAVVSLDYIGKEEQQLLLKTFNNTTVRYPAESTLISLFRDQAIRIPDAASVIFMDKQLSYRELDEQSDRLAGYLQQQYALKPGDRIGMMLNRSEKMIITILGILKAGCCFVPIDPEYPQARKSFLISDAAVPVLITETDHIFNLDYYGGAIIAIDLQLDTMAQPLVGSLPLVSANQAAYVIYTSGSTGTPKGVVIEHHAIVNTILSQRVTFDIQDNERGLQFASPSFDASVWEIFMMLSTGGALYIIDEDSKRNPALLEAYITDNAINIATIPPAYLKLLNLSGIGSLTRLITAGEAAIKGDALAFLEYGTYFNAYGPAESSICATVFRVEKGDEIPYNSVPIGKPIANTQLYILGRDRALMPIGVWGEICIGGAGLAQGYLNREELTAERFIPHPFDEGQRLYRTGDVGRWLPDGNIEFSGRLDAQVKIRGYRIETGEIEHVLQGHDSVTGAVVLLWQGKEGPPELVAYIAGGAHDEQAIRAYLGAHLPVYMIPHHFISLPEFPVTVNGKTDRKALPSPEDMARPANVIYAAGRNETELQLIAVFSEVLKKEGIGIYDDFFMLGGDSIKSIQIVARLKQRGYSLNIQDVMQHPVIAELSGCVKALTRQASQDIISGEISLSPIQQWFFESSGSALHHYNQSVLLESSDRLSVPGLKAALDRILLHHDALRMVYRHTAAGWVQENRGSQQGYILEVHEWTNDADFAADCNRLQSGVSLEEGPLFRVALFQGGAKDRLLLIAHHLVIDGVSWRIIFEDLSSLYQQYISGVNADLPQKTDAFHYWQQQLEEFAVSETLQAEEAYWSAIASRQVKGLPVDHVTGSNQVKDIASCSFVLSTDTTTRLLTRCYKTYSTEINDILLTALSLAVHEVFAATEVAVRMEGHGREQIGGDVDVTRTVGWFTTIYPVIFDMQYHADPVRQLISVKEVLHRVPGKGIGYGVLRYMGRRPYRLEPEITFNYLGDFGSGVDAADGTSLFTFSGDYHGEETPVDRERGVLLEVSGMVVEGCLQMSLRYSEQQYTADTMNRLLKSYRDHLDLLINQLSVDRPTVLTPVDLTYNGLSVDQVMQLEKDISLEDIYPLSPLQEGLYYHWAASPGSPAYFEQMSYRLKGHLDMDIIEQCYYALISRHAILRTHFIQHLDDRILQVVTRITDKSFALEKVSGDPESFMSRFKEEDRSRSFNLNKGSQMRLTVLDMEDDTYEFIWSHHHIIMDGWCISILIKEFFQLYDSLKAGVQPDLKKVHPYAEYIKWLGTINKESSMRYWRSYLAGYDTISTLPKTKTYGAAYRSGKQKLQLHSELMTAVRKVCAEAGVTENTFIQLAWGILLSRYNNSRDVVFGTIVSGRPASLEGIEEMIGLFSNAVPVRIRLDKDKATTALLERTQQLATECSSHHYVQLADVQAESTLGRNLFDHILVFENFPVASVLKDNIEKNSLASTLSFLSSEEFDRSNYDLTLTIHPGDTTDLLFNYNSSVYPESLMLQVKSHLLHIIEQLATNMPVNSDEVDIFSIIEKTTATGNI